MYRLLHKNYKILSLFIISLLVVSCEIINPDDPIPTYIEINEINLKTVLGQGTASHLITDAWVYIDDKAIGAFELPARFPVLAEGVHKISIKAGIKLNGIAATRAYYPLYKPITANITFIKDKVIILDSILDLTTSYYDNVGFEWMEDFEDGGVSLDSVSGSDSRIKITPQGQGFDGGAGGVINLDRTLNIITFKAESSEKYVLPRGNAPVFLEINYKTDFPLGIGVYSYKSGYRVTHPIAVINPKSYWNKIYINLTRAVSSAVDADNYSIFFETELDDATNEGEIFIDNIKLVYIN
ncbi:MAG: hypothetical protein K9J13_04675 [Saprospiraceae bacterium]|nr:hypothetical protein [Saprospiraceae bacterium]